MPRVRIAEAAAQELEEAAAWYEEEAPGTGERLLDAFENALTLLSRRAPTPCFDHRASRIAWCKTAASSSFPVRCRCHRRKWRTRGGCRCASISTTGLLDRSTPQITFLLTLPFPSASTITPTDGVHATTRKSPEHPAAGPRKNFDMRPRWGAKINGLQA